MPYKDKSREELIEEIESLKALLGGSLQDAGSDNFRDKVVREIFDNLPVIAFAFDVEPGNKFRVFYASKLQIAATGTEHIVGKLLEEILSPVEAAKLSRHFIKCVETGDQYEFEERFGENDSGAFYSRIIPVKDSAGRICRIVGTIRNISDLVSIRDESMKREEMYQLLLSRLPDVVVLHQESVIRFVNRSIIDVFGYTPEEVLGKSIYSYMRQPEAERLAEFNRLRSEGKNAPDQYEAKIFHKSGKLVDVEIRINYININGKDSRLVVITDISERKKIAAVEERFRNLSDMLPETVYETDEYGYISYINAAGLELFGYDEKDYVPNVMNIFDFSIEGEIEKISHVRNQLLVSDNIRRTEFTARKKDGTEIPILVHAVPLLNDGKFCGTRGIIMDLSERKREEEYRIRASKLESLGVLAGGIAHDFNNILTSILGNISLAKMALPEPHNIRDLLSDAEKASFRAKSLTQQMLALAQGGSPVKRNTSIKDLISECISFVLRGSPILCSIDISGDIPPIDIDEGQIYQVINNLMINAMQAMPGGGQIVIEGKQLFLPEGNPHYLAQGDYIRISIHDTGSGIPKEIMGKIFDPYFTTKSSGHGLGLSTAYSIMTKHGGNIEVTSEPGNTVFTIFLPAISGGEHLSKKCAVNVESQKGLSILVLEDDDSIREFLEKLLERWQYEAFFAADGIAVIAEYARRYNLDYPFDVVLLDLTIPGGMGGRETLTELLKINPGVKAIASSGYFNDTVSNEDTMGGFKAMVSKPFKIEELKSVIQSVVGEK